MKLPFVLTIDPKPAIQRSGEVFCCDGRNSVGVGTTATRAWLAWLSLEFPTAYRQLAQHAAAHPDSAWARHFPDQHRPLTQ